MIELDPAQLVSLAKELADVVVEKELDEFACIHFTIKKSRHKSAKPAAMTEEEARRLFEQHTQPPTDAEPWMQPAQAAVDDWAMRGKG